MKSIAFVAISLSVVNSLRLNNEPKKEIELPKLSVTRNADLDKTVLPYYADNQFQTQRMQTRSVPVGSTGDYYLGSRHSIKCQTMTNTDTNNIRATVEQIKLIKNENSEFVRLTVQGSREVESLYAIRKELEAQSIQIPLIADIHFSHSTAEHVTLAADKIRINPGNFVDGTKRDVNSNDFSEENFLKGKERIRSHFIPLINQLKLFYRTLRIGVNHGSLSPRMLAQYGDNSFGMVHSALEFAEIAEENDFHDFVFSMKSSNPRVMVQSYRLLSSLLNKHKKPFFSKKPFHLGVTESGDGEDGRIKSASGMGPLLFDGIGDTIRVSLTEDPWKELSTCHVLRDLSEELYFPASIDAQSNVPKYEETFRHYYESNRREIALPTQQIDDGTVDVRHWLHRDGSVLYNFIESDFSSISSICHVLDCDFSSEGDVTKKHSSADTIVIRDALPTLPTTLSLLYALSSAGFGIAIYETLLQLDQQKLLSSLPLIIILHLQSLHNSLLPSSSSASSPPKYEVADNALRYAVSLSGTEPDDAYSLLCTANPSPLFLLFSPSDEAITSYPFAGRRIYERIRQCQNIHTPSNNIQAIALQNTKTPLILDFHTSAHSLLHKEESDDLQALVMDSCDRSLYDKIEERFVLRSAMYTSSLLVDFIGEGVFLSSGEFYRYYEKCGWSDAVPSRKLINWGFKILQANRLRRVSAEFISCPSCGRTLFDLQKVTSIIKERTKHLVGVTIAVMGCIVNGPGEMSDADFGYVGGAPGKIDLYLGKKLVQRGIPMDEGPDRLIALIKSENRWVDPPNSN